MPPFVHILPPRDAFSPANSSAIATVVYEMGRVHVARGGAWEIIGTRGLPNDYGIGAVREVEYPFRARTRLKKLDSMAARLGWGRPSGEREFSPAAHAISPDESGPIFLHNCEWALRAVRERAPRARIFLWQHNELRGAPTKREARQLLARADGVICVSQFIANSILQIAGPTATPLLVVRNGVDTARFHPAQSPMPAPPTLVFVGKLRPKKGPQRLLEAAQILESRGLDFRLRIVGATSHGDPDSTNKFEKSLRAQAQSLGEKIEWAGYRDRASVVSEYQKAAIFCAPAQWNDPCPLTILEGLASGCAVVTTRRGGIAEVAGDAALYFPHENAGELAEIWARLLANPEELRARRNAARTRALDWDWAAQYEKFSSALTPVLKEGGGR